MLPEQEKKDAQQLYALKRQLITNMIQLGVPRAEAEAATTLSASGDDAEALKSSVQGANGVIKAVELNPPGGSITSM